MVSADPDRMEEAIRLIRSCAAHVLGPRLALCINVRRMFPDANSGVKQRLLYICAGDELSPVEFDQFEKELVNIGQPLDYVSRPSPRGTSGGGYLSLPA